MAAGLPVIITPGCNLLQVAESGAGLIVAPDPADVAEALKALFGEAGRAEEMGQRAADLVEEQFTWRKIASQTLSIYDRAARERLSRSTAAREENRAIG
jgi:glycosyltransferase involved in cell wall biosynthesis